MAKPGVNINNIVCDFIMISLWFYHVAFPAALGVGSQGLFGPRSGYRGTGGGKGNPWESQVSRVFVKSTLQELLKAGASPCLQVAALVLVIGFGE